jgi:hypothetical protein
MLTTLFSELELSSGAQPSGERASLEARRVLQPVNVIMIGALALPLARIQPMAIRSNGRRRVAVDGEGAEVRRFRGRPRLTAWRQR